MAVRIFRSLFSREFSVGRAESTSLQTLSNSSAERKATSYYTACMDANKTMDHLGSKPLIDLLADVFGNSWVPSARRDARQTATDFNESAWNFQRTMERTHALGLDTFFNVWVSEDDKQPTQNILQVVTVVKCVSFSALSCSSSYVA